MDRMGWFRHQGVRVVKFRRRGEGVVRVRDHGLGRALTQSSVRETLWKS